jgi:hypothetical protein
VSVIRFPEIDTATVVYSSHPTFWAQRLCKLEAKLRNIFLATSHSKYLELGILIQKNDLPIAAKKKRGYYPTTNRR